jgi:hypothetical protein
MVLGFVSEQPASRQSVYSRSRSPGQDSIRAEENQNLLGRPVVHRRILAVLQATRSFPVLWEQRGDSTSLLPPESPVTHAASTAAVGAQEQQPGQHIEQTWPGNPGIFIVAAVRTAHAGYEGDTALRFHVAVLLTGASPGSMGEIRGNLQWYGGGRHQFSGL